MTFPPGGHKKSRAAWWQPGHPACAGPVAFRPPVTRGVAFSGRLKDLEAKKSRLRVESGTPWPVGILAKVESLPFQPCTVCRVSLLLNPAGTAAGLSKRKDSISDGIATARQWSSDSPREVCFGLRSHDLQDFLALGSLYRPHLPVTPARNSGPSRLSSPITAARPPGIFTRFP